MGTIQTWLQGKKTYLMAAIGVLTAIAAWANGDLSTIQFGVALWAAIQTCFIRSAVTTETAKIK